MDDQSHQEQQRRTLALTDDTVSYAIYIAPSGSSDRVSLESVQHARRLIRSIVTSILKGYIWHRDAFTLWIENREENDASSQPYLRGETRFGDCLDDEWMIVFLLREITRMIPGSIARIQDNDGELLLIEAAEYIPSWLDPESSENRVFIFNGDLHIIPIATSAEEKKSFPELVGTVSKSPKLQDALDLIRSTAAAASVANAPSGCRSFTTIASPQIQQAAFASLQQSQDARMVVKGDSLEKEDSYASWKIREQGHFARCQIPVTVAKVLQARPELVTRACEAFYTREVFGMAACSRMKIFFPAPPPLIRQEVTPSKPSSETLSSSRAPPTMRHVAPYPLGKNQTPFVTTAVCFTKTCYAQLMGQKFHPPKIWDGIVPPPNTQDMNDPQKIKEAELGMKLTCGFEILCSPDFHGDFGYKSSQKIDAQGFPFDTDNGWRIFKNNLINRKYFGNERSGSQAYRQLEEVAQQQYLDKLSKHSLDDSDNENDPTIPEGVKFGTSSYCGHGYHPVNEIHRIVGTITGPELGEASGKGVIKVTIDDRPDDDDSWMNVDLEDLEMMMRARGLGGLSSANTGNDQTEESKDGVDIQQMLDRFGDFVQEGQGGIEGAEFFDDPPSDEDHDTENEEENENPSNLEEARTQESRTHAAFLDFNSDESENENEGGDEDEDPFASDYEERQEKKRIAKRKSRASGSDEATSYDFVFDNGLDLESPPSVRSQPMAFALDREKMKEVLAKTFGNAPLSRSASEASKIGQSTTHMEGVQPGPEENDTSDDGAETGTIDQDFRAYMAELDAELAQTNIGESFEKTVRTSSSSRDHRNIESTVPAKDPTDFISKDKGKGKKAVKEKDLEALVKEFSERSRRGHTRHGPLPLPGQTFGYDVATMLGHEGHDVEEDSDQDASNGPRLTLVDSDDDETSREASENDDVLEEVVDVDLNLAKNLLESFKSQAGRPGPGGNLLSRLGIVIPRDEGDEGSDDEV